MVKPCRIAARIACSECLKCGMCEDSCPQGLQIRDLLEKAVELFEKEKDD
ncbi:MAG: hypothetical protein II105_05460 [Ruminococcus sp.]|nr:hypothetical protein [Ruminococcus sp.]